LNAFISQQYSVGRLFEDKIDSAMFYKGSNFTNIGQEYSRNICLQNSTPLPKVDNGFRQMSMCVPPRTNLLDFNHWN